MDIFTLEYKHRYETYLEHKEYLKEHPHLLSGEGKGYYGFPHGSYPFIIIPSGFKELKFTDYQTKFAQLYLIEGKSKKEIAEEYTLSWFNSVSRLVYKKLRDDGTSIYWSKSVLEKAKEYYANSLENHGFSSRVIWNLVRRMEVTTIQEFLEKSLEDYQAKFNTKTKMYEEIERMYKKYKVG